MDKENNEKLTDQLLRGIYRMCVNRDDCEGCPFYITKCTFEEPKPSTWFDEETIEVVSKPQEETRSVREPDEGFKLLAEGFKLGSEHSEGLKLLSESDEPSLDNRNGEEFFFRRPDPEEEESEEKAEEAIESAAEENNEESAAEAKEEAQEAKKEASEEAEQPEVVETINQQADDDSEGTWLVSTTMGSVFTKYVFICSKCGYRKESFFSITPMTYCPECANKKNNPVSTQ